MIRILLVDDHPVLRHGIQSLLATQRDFEVVADAGNAADAVALATRESVDVVLMDLDLGSGEEGGIAATRKIVRACPQTRVIVFTAYDSDADIVRAVEAGAVGYLVKDSRPAELFGAIRAAAGGAAALAGPIAARLLERMQHPGDVLTGRELEVLELAAAGLANRALAAKLMVSEATVKTHLHHIFTKLDVDSRQAAVASAIKSGLIRL
ncbi:MULTISPECIES: response regulator transcription factor [unclassified Leucobacter]|uniref:response regulator transcription factor n=1 Tax=unclassified Leucobacter TaxID=2621730 RepID=UPI00165DBD3D|nr:MULTISPECIES: response regulator transcription factor [unclassified Leucobacter]MBC9927881.1 response regulator transcription factor [Leucobacter sp. cx-169]MBC9937579.1 response regulator transcription factor [Leucobacter sp. cx-87]